MGRVGARAEAIDIPLGSLQCAVGLVGGRVVAQRPVGHAVTCSVRPRQKAAAAGGGDGRSVGVGEAHATTSQALHGRGMVAPVERRRITPEGDGGILPAHIIHEEEEDIRPPLREGLGGAEERSGEQEATPEAEEKGRAHSMLAIGCCM